MDVRFGADAVDMMTEEQEISTIRDRWKLWIALADGQNVAYLAPGLRVCEGVLKLAGIETGMRCNGHVWLVHLDGDSVLIRLTNSRRLFALRTSCERVKNEVLAERAMAQARSRSYFFGFSTAARTAPREQQNQPNFSWTDGVRFGEAKTPGPTWSNVVTSDRKGRKAGAQGRGLVNPVFAQRPRKEGNLTMKEQTRDVSWRSRAAGGTFVNKMYRPYPGPSRAPRYDCAFSSRKCEMPRKAPLSFCDCACHDHHGQAICRRCNIMRQAWAARDAGTVRSVPAGAAHSTICNLSEAVPLQQNISPFMPLRQPQGKVGGLDRNLLQMDGCA